MTTTTTATEAPATKVKHGDHLVIALPRFRGGEQDNEFQVGTVASYALECGDDPIAAIDRERRIGGPLHFAFNIGVTISAHHTEPIPTTRVALGDLIRLEGRTFRVTPAANHQISLVPVN